MLIILYWELNDSLNTALGNNLNTTVGCNKFKEALQITQTFIQHYICDSSYFIFVSLTFTLPVSILHWIEQIYNQTDNVGRDVKTGGWGSGLHTGTCHTIRVWQGALLLSKVCQGNLCPIVFCDSLFYDIFQIFCCPTNKKPS